MQIKKFLEEVCNEIKYKPICKDISEELENHIMELKESYMENGMDEFASEEKAVSQMGDSTQIGKKLNKIHRPKLDWKLLISIGILVGFGIAIAFIKNQNSQTNYIAKSIAYIAIGGVICVAIYLLDYRKILKYSNIIYVASCVLIIIALHCGNTINGVISLRFLGGNLSPATICVPLYIISFIGFLHNYNRENTYEISIDESTIILRKDLIKITITSILSLCLLALIPSLTSCLILGLVYIILLYIKLLNKKDIKHLITFSCILLVGVMLIIWMIYSSPYKWNRIESSFNFKVDPEGSGWTGKNIQTIIENSKLSGKANNLSEGIKIFDEGTNYAFISIVAHFGWLPAIGIVLTLIAISIKLIINSKKIKDAYGKLLIIGISINFIFKSICNVLMNLNLGIKADFEIPFVSYGGASLIINMMCIALVLSIYRRKDILTW